MNINQIKSHVLTAYYYKKTKYKHATNAKLEKNPNLSRN